uniref:Uncharacterized protein n=1 Tax=Arundo donax TaxID=35708 RepID=A0A0A9BQ08_ARUDO
MKPSPPPQKHHKSRQGELLRLQQLSFLLGRRFLSVIKYTNRAVTCKNIEN